MDSEGGGGGKNGKENSGASFMSFGFTGKIAPAIWLYHPPKQQQQKPQKTNPKLPNPWMWLTFYIGFNFFAFFRMVENKAQPIPWLFASYKYCTKFYFWHRFVLQCHAFWHAFDLLFDMFSPVVQSDSRCTSNLEWKSKVSRVLKAGYKVIKLTFICHLSVSIPKGLTVQPAKFALQSSCSALISRPWT